jgi:hypothetical protein
MVGTRKGTGHCRGQTADLSEMPKNGAREEELRRALLQFVSVLSVMTDQNVIKRHGPGLRWLNKPQPP